MATINAYITFNGNCREAMMFYKACLGGELTFQTLAESPFSEKMPKQMKNAILHATLMNNQLVLMASDMVGEMGLRKGNTVSLMLNCNSKKEAYECYIKLSEGGEKTHPLEISYWGALFGDLTDKFGQQWLLFHSLNN